MPDAGDDLYALSPDEFTIARNELARSAKDRGDKEESERIRKLKRPTLAAWVVNQLARRHADELGSLFGLRTELEGVGTSQDLRRLAQERRTLLSHLADHARSILEAAGHPASASTIDKVSQTLMAGDTEEEREQILTGTLARELTPSGIGGFGTPAATEEVEEDAEEEPLLDPKIERLETELQEAQDESRRLEKIALEAETAAGAAREAVGDALRVEQRIQSRLEKVRRS